jgi:hypothetical protein
MLVDFGIAAEQGEGGAGALVGTPAYLAPELVHGEPPSQRSDLYSLGIVGWSLLTGRLPFPDEDPALVLLRQVREPIPPLSRAAAATPGRLARAIEELLDKDPARRPACVEHWLASLENRRPVAALAAPLERWLALREVARPFHALAVTTIGMLGAAMVILAIHDTSPPFAMLAKLLAGVVATTAMVQLGLTFRALRRAAQDGYRIEDLRIAIERRIAERQASGPERPPLPGRLVRAGSNVALASLLLLAGMAFAGQVPASLPWAMRLWFWRNVPQLLPIAWVVFWTLRSVGVMVPGTVRPALDWRWRLRLALWRSSLGRQVFRVVAFGLSGHQPASTLHRPTELMLGLAIGELWHALPDATRWGLGDLPATAEALRRRVDELRGAIAQLAALTPPIDPELSDLHDRLVRRRDLALTTLERLRLLLLRLAGETVPPGELTRQLRDARELENELLQELGAHRQVRRLLRSGPALSPA